MKKQQIDTTVSSEETEKEIVIKNYCKIISKASSSKTEDFKAVNAIKQLIHQILDLDKSGSLSTFPFAASIFDSFIFYHLFISMLQQPKHNCPWLLRIMP